MFTIIIWTLVCMALVIINIVLITNYLNNKEDEFQEIKKFENFKSKFDNK